MTASLKLLKSFSIFLHLIPYYCRYSSWRFFSPSPQRLFSSNLLRFCFSITSSLSPLPLFYAVLLPWWLSASFWLSLRQPVALEALPSYWHCSLSSLLFPHWLPTLMSTPFSLEPLPAWSGSPFSHSDLPLFCSQLRPGHGLALTFF